MLTTVQRIRAYELSIMIIVIIIGVFLNYSSRKKLADVVLLNEVRTVSYALERYKEDYWRYPPGKRIDIRNSVILSENGFAPGSKIYYKGALKSSKPIVYDSDESSYQILFTLGTIWPQSNLTSKECVLGTLYSLSCT